MSKRFRIVGINFDHFHMGDLLRMTFEHPSAEIVGICDEQPARMEAASRSTSAQFSSTLVRLITPPSTASDRGLW